MPTKKETNTYFFRSSNIQEGEFSNLKRKVQRYGEILKNTETYREAWKNSLKKEIQEILEAMVKAVDLNAEVTTQETIQNLQSVQLTLGSKHSGMSEEISKDVHRNLIKHNGTLIYQQLFNGKISVIVNYPNIEGYGQPAPPRQIGIYRPEELKEPFFLRHLEEFITEVTNWEDFDDDIIGAPNQNVIGFRPKVEE